MNVVSGLIVCEGLFNDLNSFQAGTFYSEFYLVEIKGDNFS